METRIVVSGSYLAGGRRPEIYQAFLGSCVGITLCDREARVGGLIHLLLPEPPSTDVLFQPEVSAATGLPIFLNALQNLGARRQKLEACIAGGALIDPLSKVDLTLDIGGRTAEISQRILERQGIPIVQSEIGGYFSCRIALNMSNWDTTIDPIAIPDPVRTGRDFKTPSPKQLDQTIEGILPIPQVAMKIIRMIDSEDSSFEDIASEITRDQVLSARILKLCNSVSLGPATKIDSVEKALLRIGEKSLLPLALAVSMEKFICNTNLGYSLCKGGLYNHSVWTANICRKLAELTGKASSGLAYTAGLLHDIGKVVLDQYMNAAYPLVYRKLQLKGGNLNATEKELFGIAHTDAGYRLASLWGMPESLTQTMLHHHQPDRAVVSSDLVHLTYVADLMSSRFLVGQDLEKMDPVYLKSSLRELEFNRDHFPALLATSPIPPLITR